MKCDQCVAEGERSRVYVGYSVTTAMMPPSPYYDEDGNYHVPRDPNTTTTHYNCSRGHTWSRKTGGFDA